MRIINKYSKLFVAILAVVFIFISCKKDSLDDQPVNPNTSSYISKITWTDTTSASIVYRTQTFQYDNLKRLKLTRTFSNTDTLDYNFFYNSNDELPFKLLASHHYQAGVNNNVDMDTVITYFNYDALGRRIKDSSVNISHGTLSGSGAATYFYSLAVEDYSYAGNKMYGNLWDTSLISVPYSPPLPSDITRDTVTFDADGDIILNTEYAAPSFLGATTFYITDQVTYDNKLSPFARFKKFSPNLFPYSGRSTDFNTVWSSKNVLKIYETTIDNTGYDYSLGTIYDFAGLYNYNSDGLPTKINHSYFFGFNVYMEYITL